MASLLLGMIYLAFISLGLPDALLGAAYNQPVVLQQGYGLAHRLTADLKAALEFLFGGQ